MIVWIVVLAAVAGAAADTDLTQDGMSQVFRKVLFNEPLDLAEASALQDIAGYLKTKEVSPRALPFRVTARMNIECLICRSAFAAFFEAVREGQTDDQLSATVASLCTVLGIETPGICSGAVSLNIGPVGTITTINGAPVQERYVSITANLNKNLLRSEYFLDTMTHFLSERIPERVVHAKGIGAKGYFTVTHDATKFTKAAFLDTVNKTTPVAVRFAASALKKGGSDISYQLYGFSVKFYTEEGNFDLPAINAPVFASRDPGVLYAQLHAGTVNPVTNLPDATMSLDIVNKYPLIFYPLLLQLSPRGLPASFRNMEGYSVHTHQLANANNETYFSRFYLTPDLGLKNLTLGSTTDSNFLTRDLYNAIANGSFPSWTLWLQPLSVHDVKNASANGVDVFDVTRELPASDYPLREVGKLVLNENPTNYFADVEHIAYCPGNLVPGIVGAPDKVFEGRRFFYRTAQIHRLGVNFFNVAANRPKTTVYSYNRDGVPPLLANGGSAPNYYPNSFHGPVPIATNQPELVDIVEFGNYNLDQAAAYYASLSEADRNTTVSNFAALFTGVPEDVTNATYALIRSAPQPLPDLADLVAAAIAASSA